MLGLDSLIFSEPARTLLGHPHPAPVRRLPLPATRSLLPDRRSLRYNLRMKNQKEKPITAKLAAALLPKRADNSHKGTFGKALLIAGSQQFTGAANLAIGAALRSGTGLVFAAIPESIHSPLAAAIPEAIWLVLPNENESPILSDFVKDKDAVLIGPGLGQSEATRTMVYNVLGEIGNNYPTKPMVIDADALNILSQETDWQKFLPENTILTPHEMEFSRLTALPLEEIKQNRQELAVLYAKKWQATLILKGANSLVVSPEGDCRVLEFANSVLAHGGSGDVLAGLIVGFLAQGLPAFDAASLTVWLHAEAALLALESLGHPAATLPSDIIAHLGLAMKRILKP